jgi:hypothetical protein
VIRPTAVLVACAIATAAYAESGRRVLLADADPELRRAIETTLAPWKLEVVVDDAVPVDAIAARERADAQTVRFVVWREGTDLVVFDRDRGEAEHREAPVGALDAVSAAAAALTVKTLMRLPPPPDEIVVVSPGVVADRGPELRIQTGIATRVARGSATDLGGRGRIGVHVRPLGDRGWRFGLVGELGSEADVRKAQYRGTWNDWTLVAVTSWSFDRGPWDLETTVGAGLARGTLIASDAAMTLPVQHETLGVIRAGAAARRYLGRWSGGFALDVDGILGTPTYTRANGSELFRPASFAFAFGVFAAADFGR